MSSPVYKLGILNIFAFLNLFVFRTYFVIYLQRDLLTSILIITILGSLQNLLQILFRVPLGSLSQTYGRRLFILAGLASMIVANLMMWLAWNWYLVAFGAIFIAFGMSSYWPAVFAYIGDVSNGDYGKNNGIVFALGDIGTIMGSLVAKVLLDENIGLQFALKNVYGLYASGSFVAFFVMFRLLPETVIDVYPFSFSEFGKSFGKALYTMLHDFFRITRMPGMGKVYLLQIIISFAEFGFVLFFPKLMSDYGYGDDVVASVILGGTMILLFAKPYLGRVSDKFGYVIPILLSLIMVGVMIVVQTSTSNYYVLFASYIIVISMLMISYPAVNSAASGTIDSSYRGIALGVLGVYTSLGRGLSTIIIGTMVDILDLVPAFQIFGYIIIALVVVSYIVHKRA